MSKNKSENNVMYAPFIIEGMMRSIWMGQAKKSDDTTLVHRDGQHIELLRVSDEEGKALAEEIADNRKQFYHLYVDGIKVSDELFGFGIYFGDRKTNDIFNEAQYVPICKYEIEDYDEDIIRMHKERDKERGYETPIGKHVKQLSCIVDTVTGEVVYTSQNEYSCYINILSDKKGKFARIQTGDRRHGLMYLPTKTFIYTDSYDHDRYIETEKYILVKEEEQNIYGRSPLHVSVYDKETGERVQTIE